MYIHTYIQTYILANTRTLTRYTYICPQMDVVGTSKSLQLSFSKLCPHAVLREQLESFLVATHSLPLLLKGLCTTESTMVTLTGLSKRMSGCSLFALSPPNVQLKYSHLYPLYSSVCV